MAETRLSMLAGAKRENIVAAMLIPEVGGTGFLAYPLAVPLLPPSDSSQAGQKAPVPSSVFLRVWPGLTRTERVELAGAPRHRSGRRRLIGDDGEYLRFASAQADGTVTIVLRRKLNVRK
jgi:hypothetical protein